MIITQSMLQSWSRCPRQALLDSLQSEEQRRASTLSATSYGSVVHYAVMVLQQMRLADNPEALKRAQASLRHYWDPRNIETLPGGYPTYKVTEWLPRQTWAGLQERGLAALESFDEWLATDDGRLLGLEVEFEVPIDLGPQGEHVLRGTVDRVTIRKDSKRKFYLNLEDFKTGTKKKNLRYELQWTFYAMCSTKPEFWNAWPDEDLKEIVDGLHKKKLALFEDGSGFPLIERRGTWLSVTETFGVHDCGWRVQQDYDRLVLGLREYVKVVEADIWPLSISGQYCMFCSHARNGACGGVPIAEDQR